MRKDNCRRLIVAFTILIASLPCFAQSYHFVYLQADNQQPFYVKYGDKNYSSSSIGYLILPKLTDGSFSVQIGFPKNLYPEQTFNLSIAGKDVGYALKNFDAKGWGLFNFQTTEIVMNVNAGAASGAVAPQTTTTNNNNPFGNMLADAIHDSTLNQQPVVALKDTMTLQKHIIDSSFHSLKDSINTVIKSEKNYDSSRFQSTTDSLIKNNTANANSLSKNEGFDSTNSIVKAAENKSNAGTDLTFLDKTSKDTIHAFIPSSDGIKTTPKDTANVEAKTSLSDTSTSKTDNPFFKNNTSNANTSQPTMLDTASKTAETKTNGITNSNCQKMFSSYDAQKLKKKIISLQNEEDILAAIKKSMRDKCVTTEQVKDLSNLFLSDENRYNFYDAVYPNVSDLFNYPQLQNTLIDTYYKNRFKALLR